MPTKVHDFVFLVVTGMPASGKDTVGNYLAEHYGFKHISAGDTLRHVAHEQGHEPPYSRELLGDIDEQLKEKYGPAPITRKALEEYSVAPKKFKSGLVISGLRRLHEINYAHENGAVVIYIDTPDDFRHKLIRERSREDDVSFEAREADEYNGTTTEGKNGIWIEGVRNVADITLQHSDGQVADFYKKIDNMMHSLEKN